MRSSALVVFVIAAGASGCTCAGRARQQEVPDAGLAVAAAVVDAALPSTDGPAAIFSAPIAGARVAGGGAIAVGLVVGAKAIVAARVDDKGRASWTHPVVTGVAWSPDAELHAWPIQAGAVVVWRGPVAGKNGRVAVAIAGDGHVLGGPVDVGPLTCATDDGVAWTSTVTGGASQVTLRVWPAGAASHDDVGPAIADELTLSCGARKAYATVEGDEASPTKVLAIGGGAAAEPLATIAPLALGRDEERDLFTWAEGDEVGLVRISNGGSVQAADVRAGGAALVRAERARLAPEDDVVAVDADDRQVVLVSTHDESEACPDGRGGSSVQALRIPRAGGAATTLEIAKGACGKDVGPFWMNRSGRALVLGWAERASRTGKTSAPLSGFSYRRLEEGASNGRVAQAADAIADAGCDDARCYAVALLRAPGADGMQPAPIAVLAYP